MTMRRMMMATKITLRREHSGWVLERWHLTGGAPSSAFPCLSLGELRSIRKQIDDVILIEENKPEQQPLPDLEDGRGLPETD
jgi:hypothetical protein